MRKKKVKYLLMHNSGAQSNKTQIFAAEPASAQQRGLCGSLPRKYGYVNRSLLDSVRSQTARGTNFVIEPGSKLNTNKPQPKTAPYRILVWCPGCYETIVMDLT
jgi:hypothetical protein